MTLDSFLVPHSFVIVQSGAHMRMTRTEVREWIQAVFLPIAVLIVGIIVARSNSTRELNARWVESALGVLSGPANDSTRPIRVLAVKLLNKYSPVPFGAEAESALVSYRILLVPSQVY